MRPTSLAPVSVHKAKKTSNTNTTANHQDTSSQPPSTSSASLTTRLPRLPARLPAREVAIELSHLNQKSPDYSNLLDSVLAKAKHPETPTPGRPRATPAVKPVAKRKQPENSFEDLAGPSARNVRAKKKLAKWTGTSYLDVPRLLILTTHSSVPPKFTFPPPTKMRKPPSSDPMEPYASSPRA